MTKLKCAVVSITVSAAFFLALAGCGGSGLKPVKVQGSVTLDGKPLSGANITFFQVAGEGKPASGISDNEGNFRLTTLRTDDGALPGEYHVVVTLSPELTVKEVSDPNDSASGSGMRARWGGNEMRSPEGRRKVAVERKKLPPSPVPAIYSDAKKTPLRQVVPPPSGSVKLELHSKA